MAEGHKDKMKVEIWSDIMCPFCLIGKKLYETALEQFPHKQHIETEWLSYQISPDIPEHLESKINVYQFLADHRGVSYDDAVNMHKSVAEMGLNNGVEFDFDKAIVANTFKAHRIIQIAKEKGIANEVESQFFKAFFNEGEDLADNNTLIRIGKDAGLEEVDIQQALSEEIYAYKVRQDIQEAHNIGLTGVPFFVFNRRYGISGAEPLKVFIDTFYQAYDEWNKDHNESF